MKTKDAIKHFKTASARGAKGLAQVLDISPAAIYQWGEHPPLGRQYQIEALTNGELKADPSTATEK